jgi:hypothetical protein
MMQAVNTGTGRETPRTIPAIKQMTTNPQKAIQHSRISQCRPNSCSVLRSLLVLIGGRINAWPGGLSE